VRSYSVGRIAGRGHQSVIYKAVRVADGQVCALKCVRLSALKSAAARQRVEEEVAILQSLEHPNIVKHRSLFHHQDDMYIELEWADGGDLKALLRRHAEAQMYMSELRVLGFFTQIASAVRHMHERRILHRDLKPANCLLLKEGMIKIADLGLGRHLDEDVDEAHSRVGTPLYMAPEILQSKSYNWSSDVWSMGVLLCVWSGGAAAGGPD
jgi:serine/threonine protein kinase